MADIEKTMDPDLNFKVKAVSNQNCHLEMTNLISGTVCQSFLEKI